MILNSCGPGYCSVFSTPDEVEKCKKSAPPEWNGLCAFQDGEAIVGPSVQTRPVLWGMIACPCGWDGKVSAASGQQCPDCGLPLGV